MRVASPSSSPAPSSWLLATLSSPFSRACSTAPGQNIELQAGLHALLSGSLLWVSLTHVRLIFSRLTRLAAFGYSWGPCAWILVAEIWPLSIRGKGVSIAASSNWMNNFIVGQVTPTMIQNLGFGTFVFFGAFSFVGGLFILFLVPETKGLTLEEMDQVFGSVGLAAADHQRQEEINRTIGLSVYEEEHEKRDDDSYEKA